MYLPWTLSCRDTTRVPEPTVIELRLHGALWRTVAPARAREWTTALDEFNATNAATSPHAERAWLELVRHPDGLVQLRLHGEDHAELGRVDLDRAALAEQLDEYGGVIRQMVHVDRDAPVRGFEALDYAKRVVHDEAGAWLVECAEPLAHLDLADARRLFTVLFLVETDLPEHLVRYHRMH